jgi:hypothetical protein
VLIPLHGDIEALIIDVLANDPDIAGYSPTVTSDMVGFQQNARWIEVIRQGGNVTTSSGVIDKPRVDINVFAESRTVAHDIAQLTQRALLLARGTSGFGCKITDVKIETGIYRSPDKFSDTPRFILALRLTVVPS